MGGYDNDVQAAGTTDPTSKGEVRAKGSSSRECGATNSKQEDVELAENYRKPGSDEAVLDTGRQVDTSRIDGGNLVNRSQMPGHSLVLDGQCCMNGSDDHISVGGMDSLDVIGGIDSLDVSNDALENGPLYSRPGDGNSGGDRFKTKGNLERDETKCPGRGMLSLIDPTDLVASSPPTVLVRTHPLSTQEIADSKQHRCTGSKSFPLSPSAARAKRSTSLLRLLAFGSEAQVSPALQSPVLTANWERLGTIAAVLSPLSWIDRKLGRSKGSGGKVASVSCDEQANSCGFVAGGGCCETETEANKSDSVCVTDASTKRIHTADDSQRTSANERVIDKPSENGQADSNKLNFGAMNGRISTDNNCKTPAEETQVVDRAIFNAASAEISANAGVEKSRSEDDKVDLWPAPLDDEPDPDEWALGQGEREVLASAARMGSLLVRVVTWNLHAKPTPGAEVLRKMLLPPGKVRTGG